MAQLTKNNKTKTITNISAQPTKDGRFVYYDGNLDEYFKKVSECTITTGEQRILRDMYKEIKKIKEKLNIE